jgi:cytoskeletal protein CcmA (bactofilin family)
MTHIGRSVVIDGEFTSDEDLSIDGTLKGHLQVRGGTLTIGETANIEADVRGPRIVVHGMVQGSISASERIELSVTATVNGSLSAERIVMAEGAHFNGGVDMGKRTISAKMAQYKSGQTAARV